jgi:hypothetical protein
METVDDQIQKRKEFMQTVESEKQKKEMQEVTFVPNISSYSKQLDRGDEPIHERLFRLSKAIAQHQTDQPSLTSQATFHPNIITTPLKPREGKIEDRMYQDAKDREEKRKELMYRIEKEEKKLTQPKISGSSKYFLKSKLEKQIQTVFEQVDLKQSGSINYKQLGEALQRLNLFKSGNQQRRTEQEVRIHERIWNTMDPEDTGTVEFESFKRIIWAILDPTSVTEESDEDVVAELSEEIKLLSLNKLSYSKTNSHSIQAKEILDKELTFKPNINQNSKQMDQTKLFQQLHQQHQDQFQAMISSVQLHVTQQQSDSSVTSDTPRSSQQVWGDNMTSIDMNLSLSNVSVNTSQNIMTTPRYELLLKKQEEMNIRKERERVEKIQKEMEICTFKPKINRNKMLDRRKKEEPGNHFEYLYSQKDKPKKFTTVMDTRNAEEKELEQHCTFQPNRRGTKKYDKIVKKKQQLEHEQTTQSQSTEYNKENKNTSVELAPTPTPRGYQEYVERLRKANEKEKFDYHSSLREGLKVDVPDVVDYKNKKTEFKPFSFQVESKKQKARPLLYMDVNMGPGRTGRIGIHEGDDADVLAKNFAQSYKLDEVLTTRLAELIKENIKKNIPETIEPAKEDIHLSKSKEERLRKSKTPTPNRSKSDVQPVTNRSSSALKNRSSNNGLSGYKSMSFAVKPPASSDKKIQQQPKALPTNDRKIVSKVVKSTKTTTTTTRMTLSQQMEKHSIIHHQSAAATEEEDEVELDITEEPDSSTSASTQTLNHHLLEHSPQPKRNVLESLKELKQFTEKGKFHE